MRNLNVKRLVLCACLLVVACPAAMLASSLHAAEPAQRYGRYRDDLEFLKKHTTVMELADESGQARVAICPAWQGRVMTSTCQGPAGPSFGWLNRDFIAAGKHDPVFNNYGGEDRFWLSPEAGQFALFFKPGAEQKVANWYTPAGLNEGAFEPASPTEPGLLFKRTLKLTNASNTEMELEVERGVRRLELAQLREMLGSEAASALERSGARWVGFWTKNKVTNRGEPLKAATGLISIWSLGQFRPGPKTVIIVPYVPGVEATLGPIVTPDYFGPVPENRLKVSDQAVLFLGDGQFRAKLGIAPKRARPTIGSYDFETGVLTLVNYTLPPRAGQHMYINNTWVLPQAEPFKGDVANSYNDGPAEPGAATLGGFYELETLSPTAALAKGASLDHTHATIHVLGQPDAVAPLVKHALGVDLAAVRQAMGL
ncbi:MAG: hypothetical protein K2Y37_00320 [Pirellulales bacterium]|nr:hypothetical protein [Pirellulales bacterium]